MDYLIFWVLAGQGLVTAEGQQHEAMPGDLYCLLKDEPHEYQSDFGDPWEVAWFHFDGLLAREFVDAIRSKESCRAWLGFDVELRERWLELVVTHEARGPHFAVRANTALYSLLGMITHRLLILHDGPTTSAPLDIQRIQNYVHDHLSEPITVSDMAEQANLSVPHFTRVFRSTFHVSPIQYVVRARIAQASAMLAETAMPLKQIGQAVGYPDPYYLSRMFKKVTGSSPSAYRRLHK